MPRERERESERERERVWERGTFPRRGPPPQRGCDTAAAAVSHPRWRQNAGGSEVLPAGRLPRSSLPEASPGPAVPDAKPCGRGAGWRGLMPAGRKLDRGPVEAVRRSREAEEGVRRSRDDLWTGLGETQPTGSPEARAD